MNVAPTWTLYRPRQRWGDLCVLFLVAVTSYIDRTIVAALLEPIKKEFGLSDMLVGFLAGAPFAVLYALAEFPIATWADRGNRKQLLVVALIFWSLMTAACGVAPTLLLLLIDGMGVGIGEAGAIPPAHSLIADYFLQEDRARAFALLTTASAVGSLIALAPVAGSPAAIQRGSCDCRPSASWQGPLRVRWPLPSPASNCS